jgi:tetratricopeptide (TPR) repeat protein
MHEQHFDETERFLRRQMSPEEAATFERRMLTDDRLRQQVDEWRMMILGIQESALHERLDEFHDTLPVQMETRSKSKSWLAAATTIVVIGAAALWYFMPGNKSERLFLEYFRPDPGLMSAMGASENYIFDRAMIDYKTGKYNEAIKSWLSLQQSNPASDTLNYFIGAAYLALKDTKTAQTYLQKVTGATGSIFANEANWYMGLALLKENQPERALPYIQRSSHKEKETLIPKLQH